MPSYTCAVCRRTVAFEGDLPELYPFCCDRCKLVDLGRWFREQYTINRELTPEEAAQLHPPDRPGEE